MHDARALSVVGLLALSAGVALAQSGPLGADVVRGSVQIERNGANTVIRASDRAIINYRSFDIASGELVRFVQPGANARVLNRITGGAPTRIDGAIQANGRVYFVNRAGIAFGAGSVVDAGRFYAIAGNISDRDFVRGVDRFTLTGNVSNAGSISAKDGVMLAGQTVTNTGTISSVDASTVMVAGGQVLVREGEGRMYVSVGEAQASAPAARRLSLGGGDMLGNRLFAGEASTQVSSVSSTGSVVARNVHLESTGTMKVDGTIDTSSMHAAGGDVRVLGENVYVAADIDARGATRGGEVLIGGNWQGGGEERRAMTSVVTSDATINTSGVNTGSAGTAVVWADSHTSFAGVILAKGGDNGGDGAWVEVSGKNTLDFKGFVNASASRGENGTLLLDPKNIIIADGGNTALTSTGFNTDVAFTFTYDASAVTDILNTGTGVVLQANNDITINEAISVNNPSGTGGSLTLNALRSITINQPITTDGGDVTAIANFGPGGFSTERDPGFGGILFGASGGINAGAGAVRLQVNPSVGSFTPGGIDVGAVTASRLVLDGGVAITQSADLSVDELLITTSGPVTLTRTGNSIAKLAGNMLDTADIRGTGAVTIDQIAGVNVLRSTGSMTLDFGTILQNHGIVAPSLTATARSGGVALTNISNEVGVVDLRSRVGQSATVGIGSLSFTNNANLDIAGISTAASAAVTVQGVMTQSGPIVADTLSLTSRSNSTITHTLLNSTNLVRELTFNSRNASGNSQGPASLNFAEANGLLLNGIDTAGSVRIQSPGDVTQGGGTAVTAVGFAYASTNGSLTLTSSTNNFYNFAVSGLNANVFSTNTINIENVLGQPGVLMSGFARLISSNSVLQAEPVIADHLIVRSLSNGAAEINLALAGNDVNLLTIESLGASGANLGAQNIRFNDTDGFSILRLRSGGSMRLSSNGPVNQTNANSGLIVGGALTLLGSGQWTLTDARNVVPTIAGEAFSLNLQNTGNISFGTGIDGGSGFITDGTNNFLRVVTTGSISQSERVRGDQLVLRVVSDDDSFITLENPNNNFSRLTIESRTAGGAVGFAPIAYRDADGFSLMRMTTGSDIYLQATGNVNQTGGNAGLVASGVMLSGSSGTWTFDRADNAFSRLAGTVNGSVNLTNTINLEIASINGANGISVGAGNFLRIINSGSITQSQPASGDLLVARTLSDSFTQILFNHPGNNFANINVQSNNRTNTGIGSGRIVYRDADGFSVQGALTNEQLILQAEGSVNQLGSPLPIVAAGGMRLFGTGGYVFTRIDNRFPVLAGSTGTVFVTTGSSLLIGQLGATSGLNVTNNTTLTAFGSISQTRPLTVGGTLTATTRASGGQGSISLGDLNNRAASGGGASVINLQVFDGNTSTTAAGNVDWGSTLSFQLGQVRTLGMVTIRSLGNVSQNSNGISAASLRLLGAGNYTLNQNNNTFTSLAGNAGNVTVRTNGALQITQLDDTDGLISTGNVAITSAGAITQNRRLRGVNLSATTQNDGGAAILLTGPGNFFSGTRTLLTRNAAGNADVNAEKLYVQ
ncbi:MAG: filamentous hemagglutinin N-terminal domain-containing protein [Phycisphaerae bacterium]|jgi:fibronectin-binding autotransporter adhesin